MESETDHLFSQFKIFLCETVARNQKNEHTQLLSFRFQIPDKEFYTLVRKISGTERYFVVIDNPEAAVRLAGFGDVLSFRNGDMDRLGVLSQRASEVRAHLLCNSEDHVFRDMPYLFGGVSFFPEISDPIWEDFGTSFWFVPRIILLQNREGLFCSFQVIIDTETTDNNLSLFGKYLDLLYRDTDVPIAEEAALIESDLPAAENQEIWKESVRAAIGQIESKKIRKIVLSRRIILDILKQPDTIGILRTLSKRFPNCYSFIFKSGESVFIGASPEKLISVKEDMAFCHAIAGSIRRGNTSDEDKQLEKQLLTSGKNLSEHNFVIEHIRSALEPFCRSVAVDSHRTIKKLSNIQHIYTGIEGKLANNGSLFDLLNVLHPTPAVGGIPVKESMDMIKQLESYDRGWYAGFLGWITPEWSGEFFVSIRSALLKNDKLYAFAGSGIVVDSDPGAEYEETETKLQAIKSLVIQ
jgi:menaquinone-specific isochorismate synthase